MNLHLSVSICLALVVTSPAHAAEPAGKPGASPAVPPQTVRPRPLAAEARVTLGRREQAHTSNQLGEFPTILIASKSRIPVRVKLPPSDADAPVVVGVMDGGRILLDTGRGELIPTKRGQKMTPDKQRQVHFVFEADAGEGVYRVFVHRGKEHYFLEFWVGDKLPAAKAK